MILLSIVSHSLVIAFFLHSLIQLSVMPQPAMGVAVVWIVVGPVYHAALFVPLVLAVELDGIAHLEIGDSGCEVDVVGYQRA